MNAPSAVTTRVPGDLLGRLKLVGVALHGVDWQSATARSLGAWHPAGARKGLDERLVRRWVSGERPVPPWVEDALPSMISVGITDRKTQIDTLERLASRLGLTASAAATTGASLGGH